MRNTFFVVTLMVIILALVAAPAWAKGWYIGGGAEIVSFEDDLDFIDTGVGFGFSFGYKFSPLFSLDFLWGGTLHDDLAVLEAVHGSFLAGAKFSFNDPNSFQPYLTLGLSSHAVDFDIFEKIDGTGTFFGAGADIFINENHAINVGIKSSSWTGEDSVFEYDVTTSIFSVVYNYHFLR